VYPVEAMGTVALGPVYGRVKVVGMSVLDAERAIKKHLSEFIQDPQVQVTMYEKSEVIDQDGSSASKAADASWDAYISAQEQIQTLREDMLRVGKENSSLKVQLNQLKDKRTDGDDKSAR
jgi:hypothetical protein